MFHDVVFQFVPKGQEFPKLYTVEEIGIEAYLKQIDNDKRPYAEMSSELYAWALQHWPKRPSNNALGNFLLKHPCVHVKITKPNTVELYHFIWNGD